MGSIKDEVRKALEEGVTVEKAFSLYTGMTLVPFKIDSYAKADGVLVHNDVVVGLYETKTRRGDMDIEKLVFTYNGKEYTDMLISPGSKITELCELSKKLCVPSVLIVGYENGIIGYFKICDAKGNIVLKKEDYTVKKTKTKANIGGGVRVADNYFIKHSAGMFFHKPEPSL